MRFSSTSVRVPRNTMVGLDFAIASGSGIMMACGTEVAISRVELDQAKGLFRCTRPAARYLPLPSSPGTAGSVSCNRRTRLRRYLVSLQPTTSAATRNMCMALNVYSTDGFLHRMEVQFSN